jgi:hypothetical protein
MTMQELLQLQSKLIQKNNDSVVDLTRSTTKLGQEFKDFTQNFEAANDTEIRKEETKRTKELNDNLKGLKEAIKENIKSFVKSGGGQAMAKQLVAKEAKQPAANTLRKVLFGEQKAEDTKKESFFGFTGALSDKITKREKEQQTQRDKKEYVDAALKSNDKQIIGVRNLAGTATAEQRAEGEARAKKYAEDKFDEIKKKEAALAEMERKISAVESAGFNVKKATRDERDAAAAELAEFDPRRKAEFVPVKGSDKQIKQTEKSEDQAESDTLITTFYSDTIKQQTEMGATLIASLDVQKQSLESLKKIAELGISAGEGGGSGPSIDVDLPSRAGKAGRVGKAAAGAGMLSKAGGFLARNAGKIGAIGAVGLGTYEAVSGYNEAEEQVKSGQISKEEGQVKKGEAVGSGVGGAAGAIGGAKAGAVAGAALGTIVPGLGTVVGGAVGGLVGGAAGYFGGSWLGKKAGGAVASPGETPGAKTATMQTMANEPVEKGKPLSANQMAVADMKMSMGNKLDALEQQAYDLAKKQPKMEPSKQGADLSGASAKNEELKSAAGKGGSGANTVVAPTTNNTVNNNNINSMRSPTRNQESTVNRYIANRYA